MGGNEAVVAKPVISRKQLYELFIKPLFSEKIRLLQLAVALVLLALAQSGFLLFLGPFMKALFGLSTMQEHLRLSELFSPGVSKVLPWLDQIELSRSQLVYAVPAGLLMAGVTRNIALYLYQLHTAGLALYITKVYRDRLFARLLALPYQRIGEHSPAAWMSYLMNDVLFLQTKFSDIVNSFVRDSVVMIAAIITLLIIHWPTAVLLLLCSPLIAWGMGRTGKRIAFFAEAFQRELARIADFTLELRRRFYFVRAQHGEERELGRFARVNNAYYHMIRKSLLVRASFAPVMEFLGFLAFAGITLCVGAGLMGGDFASVNLLIFFGALGLLLRPLRNIGEQIAKFQETKGSLAHSLKLFADDSLSQGAAVLGASQASAALPLAVPFAGLSISHLCSGYRQAQVSVEARDLVLAPAKAIAIIGPSGAGKSTLLKTLGGLLPPLNWQSACAWAEFTAQVSMVSQEPFLFEDSLADNLTYALPAGVSVEGSAINEALALVNAYDEVEQLPGRMLYPVRALGSNLSGGQIQRLVIARALLRRKPILLLDEATSAVDEASEEDITTRLIAACHQQGSSLVVVTHRLRWLASFDEVWFVEQGRLQARGKHSDLLQHHPRYREFYSAAH